MLQGKAEAVYKLCCLICVVYASKGGEREKLQNMFSANIADSGRVVLLRSWHARPRVCTYSWEFMLVQLYTVSSNTVGVKLFYQCVQRFINLSQLPLQGRKFRDDITKTAFRSYPSSKSSINTQAISFSLRFGLWNRPRKALGGRKGHIRFWVTERIS